jgi:hypothetical protein
MDEMFSNSTPGSSIAKPISLLDYNGEIRKGVNSL